MPPLIFARKATAQRPRASSILNRASAGRDVDPKQPGLAVPHHGGLGPSGSRVVVLFVGPSPFQLCSRAFLPDQPIVDVALPPRRVDHDVELEGRRPANQAAAGTEGQLVAGFGNENDFRTPRGIERVGSRTQLEGLATPRQNHAIRGIRAQFNIGSKVIGGAEGHFELADQKTAAVIFERSHGQGHSRRRNELIYQHRGQPPGHQPRNNQRQRDYNGPKGHSRFSFYIRTISLIKSELEPATRTRLLLWRHRPRPAISKLSAHVRFGTTALTRLRAAPS